VIVIESTIESIGDEGIEPIAVIGIGCRFPDAWNWHEFRENLRQGKESVRSFTRSEMIESGADPDLVMGQNYVKSGCILDDIEMFDPEFFGYTLAQAELIDPQQRILLECAHDALEDAGCPFQTYDADIGVFGGMRVSGYSKILRTVLNKTGSVRSFDALLGTTVDQLCMRISHALNLRGPSIGIQTACSASIVATHIACESLRNGECSTALAGASSIYVPQKKGYLHDPEMITSKDGHCRAFDARAQGTMSGEGAGMVVLRRLSDAMDNRDHIYAVIKGNAVNNDGSAKAGYRVPSVEGQTRVIKEALGMSGVDPQSITYVEANGTGTLVGDSIEIQALSRAFETGSGKKGFCGIGSVKTNIGHLTQAAGIAGLIKTVLSLKHKELYPSLNYETPNPSLMDSPFYVVRETSEWKPDNGTRRAGLNSFAIGGTNAHLVLEEAPVQSMDSPVGAEHAHHILTVSAKGQASLKAVIQSYHAFLKSQPDLSIKNICFTSNVGRYHYPRRFSRVVQSKEELLGAFSGWLANSHACLQTNPCKNAAGPVFWFSGNWEGFTGTNGFYGRQHSFCEAVDECRTLLKQLGQAPSGPPGSRMFPFKIHTPLHSFVMEYALAAVWKSWGITPVAAAGKGTGKYTAACVLDELTLKEGLSRVIEEGMAQVPDADPGCMAGDASLEKALADARILILIGPDRMPGDKQFQGLTTVRAARGSEDEWRDTLVCLETLYTRGTDINWGRVTQALPYHKTTLPTYPFNRKPCWFTG